MATKPKKTTTENAAAEPESTWMQNRAAEANARGKKKKPAGTEVTTTETIAPENPAPQAPLATPADLPQPTAPATETPPTTPPKRARAPRAKPAPVNAEPAAPATTPATPPETAPVATAPKRSPRSKPAPATAAPTPPAPGTLRAIGDGWLDHMRATGRTPATVVSYANDLEVAYEVLGETTRVAEISADGIARFEQSDAVMKTHTGRAKAQPTILKCRRALRLALTWAASNGIVPTAPYEAPKKTAG